MRHHGHELIPTCLRAMAHSSCGVNLMFSGKSKEYNKFLGTSSIKSWNACHVREGERGKKKRGRGRYGGGEREYFLLELLLSKGENNSGGQRIQCAGRVYPGDFSNRPESFCFVGRGGGAHTATHLCEACRSTNKLTPSE